MLRIFFYGINFTKLLSNCGKTTFIYTLLSLGISPNVNLTRDPNSKLHQWSPRTTNRPSLNLLPKDQNWIRLLTVVLWSHRVLIQKCHPGSPGLWHSWCCLVLFSCSALADWSEIHLAKALHTTAETCRRKVPILCRSFHCKREANQVMDFRQGAEVHKSSKLRKDWLHLQSMTLQNNEHNGHLVVLSLSTVICVTTLTSVKSVG